MFLWSKRKVVYREQWLAPGELRRGLKSGLQRRKIGRGVTKGKQRGWRIYPRTLEERASCPRSCLEWQSCFGNHMHAAERIEHGPALLEPLGLELCDLARQHPAGFMVRLHVLGDFWSTDYVQFWRHIGRDGGADQQPDVAVHTAQPPQRCHFGVTLKA